MEIWRDVAGYEGYYQVSDEGRVRSLDRITTNGYPRSGRVLKPNTLNFGHKIVGLSRGNMVNPQLVHRLVMFAFGPPPSSGDEVRHKNGIPADNRYINLEWGSHGDNERDKVRHGTHPNACKTNCKYGHLLAAPNLDRWHQDHGYRRCRACVNTANYLQKYPDEKYRKQEISDEFYTRLSK